MGLEPGPDLVAHPKPDTLVLPSDEALKLGLSAALRSIGRDPATLSVLGRRRLIYASRSPSEVVTCRIEDGATLELVGKYPAPRVAEDHGHRGGTTYEAVVYRGVLEPLGHSTPKFYGDYVQPDGRAWLFLEFLGDYYRIDLSPEPEVMMKHTAEWIGRFHAINEREFHRLPHTELKSYDLDFYVGWSRRTLAIATDHLETYPWLPGVCQRFEEFAKVLIEAPRTIAHGEFYPHNVVDRMGTAVPVDWESAACAPGEIDLAALTEGWPSAIDDLCDTAYRFARWGSDCPADHQRRLAAARMYIAFRWLGDRPTQKHRDRSPARLQRLHELASTWGLL